MNSFLFSLLFVMACASAARYDEPIEPFIPSAAQDQTGPIKPNLIARIKQSIQDSAKRSISNASELKCPWCGAGKNSQQAAYTMGPWDKHIDQENLIARIKQSIQDSAKRSISNVSDIKCPWCGAGKKRSAIPAGAIQNGGPVIVSKRSASKVVGPLFPYIMS